MIAVSPAALNKAATSTMPRWYFDFAREKKFQDRGQTYITPPLSVMYALHEGLRMMSEEGIDQIWARHHRIAATIRAGVDSYGLRLLAADGCRSDTVTAVHNPTGDADGLKGFMRILRDDYGVELAGGQGDLQGQIFRVGHLGYVDDQDAEIILAAIGSVLQDMGIAAPQFTNSYS
jgi:aspartate aminotransferase-like enzyme